MEIEKTILNYPRKIQKKVRKVPQKKSAFLKKSSKNFTILIVFWSGLVCDLERDKEVITLFKIYNGIKRF